MKNTIYRYHQIIEKAGSGNPNREKTLDAWQRRAIGMKETVMQIKAEFQQLHDKMKETYSPQVYEEKRQEIEADYNSVLESAKRKLTDDLKAVIESKKAQFDRCSGAPTAEDLRLLNALSMRDKLTPAEIAAVAGKFNGNVQAIRVLHDIANRHGIDFPDMGDPETFENMLTDAESFSLEHIKEIGTDPAELGYKGVLFWTKPGEGEAKYYFSQLDNQGFTTEQITESKADNNGSKQNTEPGSGTGAAIDPSDMWAEVKTNGQQNILTIAGQFHVTVDQIRKANPGKDLDHLKAGDKIFVPSTRFSFQPDPSGGHVQPGDVRPIVRPDLYSAIIAGPNNEDIGDDIDITRQGIDNAS